MDTASPWVDRFRHLETEFHTILHVTQWTDQPEVEKVYAQEWGLVFLDQHPETARVQAARRIKQRAQYIVMHDAYRQLGQPGFAAYADEFQFFHEYLPPRPFPVLAGPPTLLASQSRSCFLDIDFYHLDRWCHTDADGGGRACNVKGWSVESAGPLGQGACTDHNGGGAGSSKEGGAAGWLAVERMAGERLGRPEATSARHSFLPVVEAALQSVVRRRGPGGGMRLLLVGASDSSEELLLEMMRRAGAAADGCGELVSVFVVDGSVRAGCMCGFLGYVGVCGGMWGVGVCGEWEVGKCSIYLGVAEKH